MGSIESNSMSDFKSPFGPDRFAREPWRYRSEATDQERAAQAEREAALRAQGAPGDCEIGAEVYISPGASVGFERLRIGDRCFVASEVQLFGEVSQQVARINLSEKNRRADQAKRSAVFVVRSRRARGRSAVGPP